MHPPAEAGYGRTHRVKDGRKKTLGKSTTESAKSLFPADPGPYRVVVVGAGMAGLSAALHLAERGLSPLVLEADPLYCGGRVAGGDVIPFSHGGQTWRFRDEHGVHAIWSPYRNLQAMLTRHNIRPMFVPAQEESWIYKRRGQVFKAAAGSAIRDSWVPAPFHYLALFIRPRFLRMLGLRDWLTLPRVWYSLVFALGIDPLAEGQPMPGLWLSDFVKGWSPALRAFFIGLARNGLSAHPEEIPLSGFIAFLRFYTLRRRDSWVFSYMPADGGTALVEPMAEKLREKDGMINLGHIVTHLERESGNWRVHWRLNRTDIEDDTTQVGYCSSRHVILATDAPNTAKILRNGPHTSPIAADLHWPRGMPTAVIRLWFDRTPDIEAEAGIFSGEFVLDNYFWLHRLQPSYLEWHKATAGSAVEVHIYGPPERLEEPDVVLLARAVAEVNSAFPELRGHLIHQFIRRHDATHTLFSVGPSGRHLGIKTPWEGLFCCGDWVRHLSPAFFLERACVTGIAAANAVLESQQLQTWPILDPPEPERLAGLIERWMLRGRRTLRRRKKSP